MRQKNFRHFSMGCSGSTAVSGKVVLQKNKKTCVTMPIGIMGSDSLSWLA